MLERELLYIAAGTCRSRGPERAVLERKLRDVAAGSYRSRGPNRAVLERSCCILQREAIEIGDLIGLCWRELLYIVARSFRSRGPGRAVLKGELLYV